MPRPRIGLALLVGGLLVASFAIKLAIRRDGEADLPRLTADVQAHLTRAGFAPARSPGGAWLLSATRADCRIAVGNGDGGAALDALRLDMPRARLLIGYRGRWQTRPAAPRAAIERLVQERAFALGPVLPRNAVLNVAIEGVCPAPGLLLDGLQTWPRARPAITLDPDLG